MIKTNQIWEMNGERLIVSIVTKTRLSCYNCTSKMWTEFSQKNFLENASMLDLD